jgi:thiamine biosynthesis lipoprotein
MKQTRALMGMPITVEIVDPSATSDDVEKIFQYFDYVDRTFSTYKSDSEISRLNRGELTVDECGVDLREILTLSEETRRRTNGFFDIRTPRGPLDPSGLVKGWAIRNAARMLEGAGFKNTYVEAGGDIQVHGRNAAGDEWRVGIRHPFEKDKIVKVLHIDGVGIATSGTYERGQHIYNPHDPDDPLTRFVSLTVIGPDVYEADRFATAAFAMGREGIDFLERLDGFEGYLIDRDGIALQTSGFDRYTHPHDHAHR